MSKAWFRELNDDETPRGEWVEFPGRILTDEEYREHMWDDYVRRTCELHGIDINGGDDE